MYKRQVLIHQLHLILSGLRTLSGSNHWDYAAARRAQERAAAGCYFFPEAENITTVPLTLVLTFSKCSESICVKPSSESFVFEKMPF